MRNCLFFFTLIFFLFSIMTLNSEPSLGADLHDELIQSRPVGGTLTMALGAEPASIHPLFHMDSYGALINSYLCDSLLIHNPHNYDWKPALAEKWEISSNQKEFTFFLRKGITFHDGTPITAEDVKFTFDIVHRKDHAALLAHLHPFFQGFDEIKVLSPQIVKFYTKQKYFKNFYVAASFPIIPKHIYGDLERSKKMNRDSICSGPYKFETFAVGQRIVLSKNYSWYGTKLPEYAGYYNFNKIVFKAYPDETIRFQALIKGDIDYMSLNAESYDKASRHPLLGKSFFAIKSENNLKPSFNFITWNNRNSLFQDVKIRKALSYLLERQKFNNLFRFGLSDLPPAPIPAHLSSSPANLQPILFDPKTAAKLLSEAGWKDSNQDGILDRIENNKRIDFKFKIYFSEPFLERYLTMYQDTLKKAGIQMSIERRDWGLFVKSISERQYEAAALSFAFFDNEPDPRDLWHSHSISQSGSNFSNYSNPEVDHMIDEARQILNRDERIKAMQKIYARIAEDVPVSPLFSDRFSYSAISSKIQRPPIPPKFELDFRFWWEQKSGQKAKGQRISEGGAETTSDLSTQIKK